MGEGGASTPKGVKPSPLDTYAGPFRTSVHPSVRPGAGGRGGGMEGHMYGRMYGRTYGMVLHMCQEEKASPPSGPMPKKEDIEPNLSILAQSVEKWRLFENGGVGGVW